MYRLFPVIVLLAFFSSPVLAHDLKPIADSPTNWAKGYTLILVDADTPEELADARDFIVSKGGTVAIVLPPRAIYGWIPKEVKARILGKRKIRSVHYSTVSSVPANFRDRETLAAVHLFNDIASGKLARDKEQALKSQAEESSGFSPTRPPMLGCEQAHPEINKEDFIRNLQLQGATKAVREAQANVTPNYFDNSNTMDGSVAVGVFFVESNGSTDPNIHNWSQNDVTATQAQVIDGLNWWVDQSRAFNLSRPLQFTVRFYEPTNPVCQQPYEPILREGRDAWAWVNAIMNNLGYTSGDSFVKVAAFDRNLRDQNRADWGFSIFIAYNPPPSRTSYLDGRASWAYLGGPYVQLLYRSFGWTVSQLVSHETGHIFYACDEYNQPGYQTCSCSCAPEVRPDARNGNCEENSCNTNSTACMMRINEYALCPFTVAQIGWIGAIQPRVPTVPSNLAAAAPSPTQVTLTWQDTADNESGFQIERSGGSDGNFTLLTTAAANVTEHRDTTVLANTIYTYRIRAFNSSGSSQYSAQVTVTTPATPTALTITTTSLPDATTTVPYSRTISASGGTSPYRWVVESGSLAPSMNFSQFGDLSGTPTSAGTFNFTVRVTDAANATTNKTLTLLVQTVAPLTITTRDLPRASVGTTYSQQLGATGGQTPYVWAIQSGSPPDGLNLNQNGTISGTPERAGSSSFTLRLTDATQTSVTALVSIIVNPATLQLTIETPALPDGVVGQEYSQTLRGAGGQSPYTWAIRNGSLPNGLSLNTATGVISGRPITRTSQVFDIELTDQSGQLISKPFDIDIEPAPELAILTDPQLPPAAVGVPYRVELKATSGTEPYFWKKKKKKKFGAFPDGISLSSDGVLSGTPTTQGGANFTVIVTDSSDRQASRPFSVQVNPPPPPLEIRTAALANGTLGLPYNAILEAGGGVGPYSWTIDVGQLPSGLTLAESGAITGRPTSVNTTSFTVRLRDAIGTSSTKQFSITVVQPPPPLVIQTVSLPETAAELSYRQTLQASGGIAPYTWSLANGSLGPGLSLSADGVISGTPTAAGTVVFGVRVTDSAQQTAIRTLAIKINPADKLAPFGVLETPDHNTTLNASITVTGWALDNIGVTKIEVLVDNQKVGDATYNIARPDVAVVWGSFPNGNNAGFRFTLDTTLLTNGDHQLAVRFSDFQGNITIVGSRRVQVQNRLLQITSTNLPRGRRGDAYNFQMTAADGRPPYVWTITTGNLPPGLSLNAAGLISGTPTAFGNFSFVARVTDSANGAAVASLTLLIQPDVELLQIISRGDLTAGQTGVDYTYQLLFAGGAAPRTWSLATGQLPPGLAISETTGLLSGRPTQVGDFTFTMRLSDATSSVVSEPLRISITPGPLVIMTTGDLTAGITASPYSYQLTYRGGRAPVGWSLPSGSSLPPGLTLSSNGLISGSPTQTGTFSFTVRLTDSQNPPVATTSGTLRIIVTAPPLTITSTGDLTAANVNVAYTHQLTFTGGVAPVAWSLPQGSGLPPGLTLNAQTGIISGTPTQGGSFSFTVRLTDSQNPPVSVTSSPLRIVVTGAPLQITSSGDLLSGKVGQAYSTTLTYTGGAPPVTWNVQQGVLPPGISLNAQSGVLSGTPTQQGLFSFTVRLIDSTNQSVVSSLLRILVNP